jgi:hypothetical protein
LMKDNLPIKSSERLIEQVTQRIIARAPGNTIAIPVDAARINVVPEIINAFNGNGYLHVYINP